MATAEWSTATGRSRGESGPRYISRLEAIKEAVSRHMAHMAITEPHNKVNPELDTDKFAVVMSNFSIPGCIGGV